MPAHRLHLANLDDLVQRYVAGEPAKHLANEAGVSDSYLRDRLRERGIAIRGKNTYARDMEPAHAARRGTVDAPERKAARAVTRQARMLGTSAYEDQLAGLLSDRSVTFTRQQALGPYNLDFALHEGPIAVEIRGGGYNARVSERMGQRVEYVLGRGLSVVEIDMTGQARGRPMDAAADYVVTYLQELRRNPTAPREHRVIRPDGQPGASGRRYLDQRA